MRIGLVSDTHGYVDDRLIEALSGVDAILHAGDVGSTAVIEALALLAPVFAVQGNNDARIGGLGLPTHLDLNLGGVAFHLIHELRHARPGPATRVVVSGHSHRPLIETRDGVLYVNPGAAGRVGFHALQTAALMTIDDGEVEVTPVELGPRLTLPRPKRAKASA